MGRKRNSLKLTGSTSVRQKAYQFVHRKIVSGELPPGHVISEVDIAKELGSSRTPLREAISQLIAEGLLEQSPGGSITVVRFTRDDIVDLCELREALETYALSKAAREGLMRPNDKVRLQKLIAAVGDIKKELVKSGKGALDEEGMKRFIAVDFAFHATLIGLSHNVRLTRIVNDTRLLMRIFTLLRRGHTAAELERIAQRHVELLNHLERRDVEATAKAIAEYLQESQRERLAEFDNINREKSIRESMPAFIEELYKSLGL